MAQRKPLGELLIELELIDAMQLRAALGEQARWGKRLGETLVQLGFIADDQLLEVLSRQLKIPPVKLAQRKLEPAAVAMLPEAFCRENSCIAFDLADKGRFLDVAMADPLDIEIFEQIRTRTRCNPRPHIAGPLALRQALDRAFPASGPQYGEVSWQPAVAGEAVIDFDGSAAPKDPPRTTIDASPDPPPRAPAATPPPPAAAAAAADPPLPPIKRRDKADSLDIEVSIEEPPEEEPAEVVVLSPEELDRLGHDAAAAPPPDAAQAPALAARVAELEQRLARAESLIERLVNRLKIRGNLPSDFK